MTDENIHPDAGADEDAKIWAEFAKADAAAAAGPGSDPNPDPAPNDDQNAADPGAAASDKPEDQPQGDAPAGDAGSKQAGTADAAPAQAPDIWANATPEQRAAFEQLQTNYRRVSGTVSALQRKIDALAAGTAQPAPAKRGGKPPTTKSILDDPEIQKVEGEYPEVIGPLKKVFQTLEQRTEATARLLATMDAAERARHAEQQEVIVKDRHQDYDAVRTSKAFLEWFKTAPGFVREGIERNGQDIVDAYEVSTIVDLFKSQTGWKSPQATQQPAATQAPGATQPAVSDKRKHQLESAASPRGGGQAPRAGQPQTDEDWWKHWEQEERRAAARR